MPLMTCRILFNLCQGSKTVAQSVCEEPGGLPKRWVEWTEGNWWGRHLKAVERNFCCCLMQVLEPLVSSPSHCTVGWNHVYVCVCVYKIWTQMYFSSIPTKQNYLTMSKSHCKLDILGQRWRHIWVYNWCCNSWLTLIPEGVLTKDKVWEIQR